MIGPAPEHSWDKFKGKKTGEIPVAKKEWRERGNAPYSIYSIDKSAPDDVKLDYEKEMNKTLKWFARFYVPDMKEPYYTWDGKIVEKSSLKGRKLPLV